MENWRDDHREDNQNLEQQENRSSTLLGIAGSILETSTTYITRKIPVREEVLDTLSEVIKKITKQDKLMENLLEGKINNRDFLELFKDFDSQSGEKDTKKYNEMIEKITKLEKLEEDIEILEELLEKKPGINVQLEQPRVSYEKELETKNNEKKFLQDKLNAEIKKLESEIEDIYLSLETNKNSLYYKQVMIDWLKSDLQKAEGKLDTYLNVFQDKFDCLERLLEPNKKTKTNDPKLQTLFDSFTACSQSLDKLPVRKNIAKLESKLAEFDRINEELGVLKKKEEIRSKFNSKKFKDINDIKEEGWNKKKGKEWIEDQIRIVALEKDKSKLGKEIAKKESEIREKERKIKNLENKLKQVREQAKQETGKKQYESLEKVKELEKELNNERSEIETLRLGIEDLVLKVKKLEEENQQLQIKIQKMQKEIQSDKEKHSELWKQAKEGLKKLAEDAQSKLRKKERLWVDELLEEKEKVTLTGDFTSKELEDIKRKLRETEELTDEEISELLDKQETIVKLGNQLVDDTQLERQLKKTLDQFKQFLESYITEKQEQITNEKDPNKLECLKEELKVLEDLQTQQTIRQQQIQTLHQPYGTLSSSKNN